MAQETLEDAMNISGYHDKEMNDLWRSGVEFGVEWQQERMLKLHEDWEIYTITNFHPDFKRLSFKSYIEQFSK